MQLRCRLCALPGCQSVPVPRLYLHPERIHLPAFLAARARWPVSPPAGLGHQDDRRLLPSVRRAVPGRRRFRRGQRTFPALRAGPVRDNRLGGPQRLPVDRAYRQYRTFRSHLPTRRPRGLAEVLRRPARLVLAMFRGAVRMLHGRQDGDPALRGADRPHPGPPKATARGGGDRGRDRARPARRLLRPLQSPDAPILLDACQQDRRQRQPAHLSIASSATSCWCPRSYR
jgi:hypothetical protein